MKREITTGAALFIAVGLIVAIVRGMDLIGADTLRVLALILAVPAGVAVMALGFTPLVRAWRLPVTPPPERHIIRETRLHTIDHQRTAEQPMPAVHPANLYPALQSPEWRAGLLSDGRQQPAEGNYWEVESPQYEPAPDQWNDWPR